MSDELSPERLAWPIIAFVALFWLLLTVAAFAGHPSGAERGEERQSQANAPEPHQHGSPPNE